MSSANEPVPQLPASVRAARDKILDDFEAAWRNGERPAVEAFLPPEPGLRVIVAPMLVEIDFERRLKGKEEIHFEEYFLETRFPELAARHDLVLSLLVAEWKFGPAAGRQRLLDRYPKLCEEATARLETLPPTSRDLRPMPTEFGRYHIRRFLGAGKMGAVYLADDPVLVRQVALKTPLAPADPLAVERFRREIRAASHLHHTNICPVYEADSVGDIPYLTMAYIDGPPLTEKHPPPLAPRLAVDLVRRLALALAYAHSKGVIHRDLKPSNILVDPRGEPVITDFGLARRLLPGDAFDTADGLILGAPAYMPPEQAAGDPAAHGPASDVYTLGVIFYELLTKRLPFQGRTILEVLDQVRFAAPPPPSLFRDDLDARLEAICLKAMAKKVKDRFDSMTAFADALAAWQGGAATQRSPDPQRKAPPPDPRAAEWVHQQLGKWGWEVGIRKVKAALEEEPDESRKAGLRVALGWLEVDRGRYKEGGEHLEAVAPSTGLTGWSLAGRAMTALREKDYDGCRDLLVQAAAAARPEDVLLRATVAHLDGARAHHEGHSDEALRRLSEALEAFGDSPFGAGRVLDTLGMVYAGRNNLPAACEYYAESLRRKRQCGDKAGVAVTNGQLGRLHLDWGQLDEADGYFREAVEVVRQTEDARGEAQLYNHRGQVLLARGRPLEAVPLLDETIRMAHGRWSILEGFAHKDRALTFLALNDLETADRECDAAESLFLSAEFAEGAFHVQGARGRVRRQQGRFEESLRCLRSAADHFERSGEPTESARALREAARTLKAAGASPSSIEDAFTTAAAFARRGRRARLADAIERERDAAAKILPRNTVHDTPEAASDPKETVDVDEGLGTALVVSVRRADEAVEEPAALVQARNHLFMDLAPALAAGRLFVDRYRGDGFTAAVRGRDHARRAATAALAVVRVVAEINRPRRVLNWPLWRVHAVVVAGTVCRAAVGGFEKQEMTTTGPAVQLAADLLPTAEANGACLNRAAFEQIGPGFRFRSDVSRTLHLPDWGEVSVWDLVAPSD